MNWNKRAIEQRQERKRRKDAEKAKRRVHGLREKPKPAVKPEFV